MADLKPVAQHLGFDQLDSGQLVATYFVPVPEPVAPILFTAAQLEQAIAEAIAPHKEDTDLLNWLEQHDGAFYNIDRISAIVEPGFSSTQFRKRTKSLREAIREAMLMTCVSEDKENDNG